MIQDIILAGAGGCMREIAWQIQEQNKAYQKWNVIGYVDCKTPEDKAGVTVGTQKIAYLGDDSFLLQQTKSINAVICTGNPMLRRKIAETYRKNPNIKFPNLILGNTQICEDIEIGMGCIISMNTKISTNVKIGNFVFMNIDSMVCHDGMIADFVTLGPNVSLAGQVAIGAFSSLGLATKVIQGIQIGKHVVTGAGSVIVNHIEDNLTVAGVPARKLK